MFLASNCCHKTKGLNKGCEKPGICLLFQHHFNPMGERWRKHGAWRRPSCTLLMYIVWPIVWKCLECRCFWFWQKSSLYIIYNFKLHLVFFDVVEQVWTNVCFFPCASSSLRTLGGDCLPIRAFCPRLQKDDPCRFALHPDSYLQRSSIETQSEDLWNDLSLWLVK